MLRYALDIQTKRNVCGWIVKKLLGLVTAATVVVALAPPAKATLILSGGTAGTIPNGASNEFLGPLFGGAAFASGYYDSQILLDTGGQMATVVFEFYGAEAGYHNEFNISDSPPIELFDHPGGTFIAPSLSAPLSTVSGFVVSSGPTLVSFSFDINNDALHLLNGFNSVAAGPNFFASCAPIGPGNPTSCDSVYLFLDDGGAGPDNDHDDFLVRMTLNAIDVPEPSSLAQFAAGAVAIGFVLRRRRINLVALQ